MTPIAIRPPASDAALDALACRLGGTLPDGLLRSLRNYNGGQPERTAFEVPGLGWTTVSRLYGTGTGDAYSIETVSEMVEFQHLPPGTIPVGEDPGGNLLLLDKAGAVWFVAHCGWPLGSQPATVRLAADLEAFLGGLVDKATVPRDRWPVDYAAIAAAAGHPEWDRDPPDGHSWHYDVPGKTMQLVPRDIHWMAPHVASILAGAG